MPTDVDVVRNPRQSDNITEGDASISGRGPNPSAPTTTADPTPGAALDGTHAHPTPAHPQVDHNGHVKDRNRGTL